MTRCGSFGAKVLVVGRPDGGEAVGDALGKEGHQVVTATSGAAALGMLEWECPDVIVGCARVDDMDGYELFTRVRKEPAAGDTPFVLLAGRDRHTALAVSEAGAEMVLTGDATPDLVVTKIAELLQASLGAGAGLARRVQPASARPPVEPLWAQLDASGPRPPARDTASFQGSLGVMDLAEVTQAIALGGKTGSLQVALSAGVGAMLFEAGRLVHASFAEKAGEAAFAALIAMSQRDAQASFRFDQADRADLARVPRTIRRSLDQLLLNIAADLDEGGSGGAPSQAVPLTRR